MGEDEFITGEEVVTGKVSSWTGVMVEAELFSGKEFRTGVTLVELRTVEKKSVRAFFGALVGVSV